MCLMALSILICWLKLLVVQYPLSNINLYIMNETEKCKYIANISNIRMVACNAIM